VWLIFPLFFKALAVSGVKIMSEQGATMKKLSVLLICLTIGMVCATGVFAEKTKTAATLPPVIAQVCGQANTVIMWHDIDNDGLADYKATYVFKDGKLHQMGKSPTSQEELGILIRRRQ
jgi:hypothetical protein